MHGLLEGLLPPTSAPSLTPDRLAHAVGGWEHGEQKTWSKGQGGHLSAAMANEPKSKKVSWASEKC